MGGLRYGPLSVALASLLLFLLPSSLATDLAVSFHGGPVLSGEIKLAILWYGEFGRTAKTAVRNFVKSLNIDGTGNPSVASWWHIVESYQSAAAGRPGGPSPRIMVKVEKQITDNSYKYGRVITVEYIPKLLQDAACGDPSLIPVIFAGREVTVHGLCYGKCEDHGVVGTQSYIIVGNPESECPGECAYPFVGSVPGAPLLKPPSGNIGADAVVVAFAQGLADLVTNPQQNSGFFKGRPENPIDISDSCRGIFGSGGGPNNPGKVLVCPVTGGAYNAIGNNAKKFLLPAIWNPATNACWTVV